MVVLISSGVAQISLRLLARLDGMYGKKRSTGCLGASPNRYVWLKEYGVPVIGFLHSDRCSSGYWLLTHRESNDDEEYSRRGFWITFDGLRKKCCSEMDANVLGHAQHF